MEARSLEHEGRVVMKCKLTQLLVNKVEPKDTLYKVRDSITQRLYVAVRPSGRHSYYLDYRIYGKRGNLKLGGTSVPLADIRKVAQAVLVDIANGQDPVLAKRRKKREGRRSNLSRFGKWLLSISMKYS